MKDEGDAPADVDAQAGEDDFEDGSEDGLEDEGGEPACWLHRLCPECDAVQDAPHPQRCRRCGAALTGGVEGLNLG